MFYRIILGELRVFLITHLAGIGLQIWGQEGQIGKSQENQEKS